jgi:hypothetical protein
MYYTTTIENSEANGVKGVSHDFGNRIRVVTDFEKKTTQRIHGDIIVKDYPYEPDTELYARFLANVELEVEGFKANVEPEVESFKASPPIKISKK